MEINEDMKQAQQDTINQAPKTKKNAMIKAYNKTASPRAAIKAKCLECVNFENPSETIGGCTAYRCGIYAYRPYQK